MASSRRERLRQRFERLARPRSPEPLPVVLDRHRIYLLPTRFGLFCGTLLAVMLLGALNYNNNPALLLALLVTSVALAGLLAAHLRLSGLEIGPASGEPVAAGTPLLLRLELIEHDGRARAGLRMDCGPATAFVSLPAGTRHIVELALPTTRRGWLDPGRIRLSTTQPLGLARAWSWIWPDTMLLVYPAPERDGPPLPPGEGGTRKARLHPLGSDVHHLRDYRSGDSPHAIAWKASARKDTLIVRETELPQGEVAALDWRAVSALPHEQRIARLAHWVELAEREGRRSLLRLPGQPPLGPGHGPAHRHLCLRALALLPDA